MRKKKHYYSFSNEIELSQHKQCRKTLFQFVLSIVQRRTKGPNINSTTHPSHFPFSVSLSLSQTMIVISQKFYSVE